MDSERQIGHLLGVVKRLRFLKTKPQSRQRAGREIKVVPLRRDRST